MKVFIALRVPRDNPQAERLVGALTGVLQASGHTPFVAYQEIARRALTPAEFMPYVRQEISTSDLIIVVYSPDLRGGLIELGIAYAIGIPIWLIIRLDESVSSSALACASQVIAYRDTEQLKRKLQELMLREDQG